jgi:hypothetical protein
LPSPLPCKGEIIRWVFSELLWAFMTGLFLPPLPPLHTHRKLQTQREKEIEISFWWSAYAILRIICLLLLAASPVSNSLVHVCTLQHVS